MQNTCMNIESEKLFPRPPKASESPPSFTLVNAPQLDITCLLRESPEQDPKDEICTALSKKCKEIPSVLLWDDKGLALFEKIREGAPDAYYPSWKETSLLSRSAIDVAARIPGGTTLIELGTGYV